MAPKAGKKRKSSDEENLDSTVKCRSCDKMIPMCRIFECSRNRQHFACIDCLRITAEEIVFEGADNYNHEIKGINCYRNKCVGVFPYDEVKHHLIPEMSAALNSVMTKFNCSVCCFDHSMKDGITCQKVEQSNKDNEESHTFCLECIKEFASRDETALAYGGLGLGCMQNGCKHALMLNHIKNHLPKDLVKKLEERVMDENIGHAEIEGLQRCQKCNYAVEVIGGRYFTCVCGNKQCITCGDTFDNKHTYISCQKKKSKTDQTLDDQINDVVVRLCQKCNLQFVKSSGCNFMRCRCGATQCYICREKNITDGHFCKCPGLQEECKCPKKCRQFADASKIDAHRIELLKSHVKSGKKVSNKEILSSMPQSIPDNESDEDDDDDDDDDDGDFAEDISDFDSDEELEVAPNLGGGRLEPTSSELLISLRRIRENREREFDNAIIRLDNSERRNLPPPVASSDDEEESMNGTINLDSDGDEEDEEPAAGNASSEEEIDSDEMFESATQSATVTFPLSDEDDSDFDVHIVSPPAPRIPPKPLPRRVYSNFDSSDNEFISNRQATAKVKPSSDDSSDDEVLVKRKDDSKPSSSIFPRLQALLEDSSEDEVIPKRKDVLKPSSSIFPRHVLQDSSDDTSDDEITPKRKVVSKPSSSLGIPVKNRVPETSSDDTSDDEITPKRKVVSKPSSSFGIPVKKRVPETSSDDTSDDEIGTIPPKKKAESSSDESLSSDGEIGVPQIVYSSDEILDSSPEEVMLSSDDEEW